MANSIPLTLKSQEIHHDNHPNPLFVTRLDVTALRTAHATVWDVARLVYRDDEEACEDLFDDEGSIFYGLYVSDDSYLPDGLTANDEESIYLAPWRHCNCISTEDIVKLLVALEASLVDIAKLRSALDIPKQKLDNLEKNVLDNLQAVSTLKRMADMFLDGVNYEAFYITDLINPESGGYVAPINGDLPPFTQAFIDYRNSKAGISV